MKDVLMVNVKNDWELLLRFGIVEVVKLLVRNIVECFLYIKCFVLFFFRGFF